MRRRIDVPLGGDPMVSIKSFTLFVLTCFAAAIFVFTTAGSAQALELCAKADRRGDPTQPKNKSKITMRTECRAGKEVSLGTTDNLAALKQSVDDDGNDMVEIRGDILKFLSPIPDPTTGAAGRQVRAPNIGETESYCAGSDFPGELGANIECTSVLDCNGICVIGATGLLGTACSQDFECNSQASNDGVCSSDSICQEYAVMAISGTDVYFAGFNVHVRSGVGATDAAVNGLGNLIVGYDEEHGNDPFASDQIKTGSHNLVVGPLHTYTSYGGLVAGVDNRVIGPYSSVSGGHANVASGASSSVSGGYGNIASENYSSVSGGGLNNASGEYSSVSGGWNNTASNIWSSVSGGQHNTASGSKSSVSGGDNNTASGTGSSVSGGQFNDASGPHSSVSGGSSNIADGHYSSVSGGFDRTAAGTNDWVAGTLFEDQ